MIRIKQLPAHEAQKIAAGEVVERPANVVKELVENSLDAKASTITISIEDAGKALIRVVDDGCGMGQEDARLCFAHHATSKITTVNDLPTLTTFGFRGEALSSISAVSHVTLITKEESAAQGTQLTLEAGTITTSNSITCNNGTDISISQLFFNVPARKKFLKTRETEQRQIVLLFQAFCFDYLDVHFKLIVDGTQLFNCPATFSLQERVAQIWDHTVAGQMVSLTPVQNSKDIGLHGIVSNHTYGRYDRSGIFFFVNKRWVKNASLSKALLKGYMNVLQPDRFPSGCIFITLDPAVVDINIHPRKEEVQFLNPKVIEQLIQQSVKTTLENHLSATLNKKVQIESPASFGSFQSARKIATEHYSNHVEHHYPALRYVNNFTSVINPVSNKPAEINALAPEPVLAQQSVMEHAFNEAPLPHAKDVYHILGQFKKTYILIEQEDGLCIVDQHAAHERVLYELFSKRFDAVASTKLLFPQIISLSVSELEQLACLLTLFKNHHIEIEQFGENQIIILSIPTYLKDVPLEPLIKEALSWLSESHELDESTFKKKMTEKLHAQMACKAAVKAGDVLTNAQMHQLLDDLCQTENRLTCPHGRPTGWDISLYEIEKKFKRKV
jgi:DNA mismatch repair protein MutL